MIAEPEVELSEAEHARLEAFDMPEVYQGATVLWYRHGTKEAGTPETVTVIRVRQRAIGVRLADNSTVLGVRHIDDPKLTVNEHHRENGGWDHSDDHKFWKGTAQTMAAEVADMKAKVAALEDLVLGGKKKERDKQ